MSEEIMLCQGLDEIWRVALSKLRSGKKGEFC